MPNHVTNYLHVWGGYTEDVEKFFETIKGKNSKGETIAITFNSIIPMPAEIFRGDLGERERLEWPGEFNWYDWSIKNWGTKWDAYSIKKIDSDRIQFDTAWSVPMPVLIAASKLYPGLTFTNEWIEETLEAAGRLVFENGRCIIESTCSYSDWSDLDPDCLIHKLNLKYERDSYIAYLNEILADGDPEAEFYLKHLGMEMAT